MQSDNQSMVVFALPPHPDADTSDLQSHWDISGPDCEIIGLHTENPVMRCSGYMLQGTWDEALGTHLVYEAPRINNEKDERGIGSESGSGSEESASESDAEMIDEQTSKMRMMYKGKTTRILKFEIVNILPREDVQQPSPVGQ